MDGKPLANQSPNSTYQLPKHPGSMTYPQGKTIKPGEGMIRFLKEGATSGGIDSEKLTQEDAIDFTVIISDQSHCSPEKTQGAQD